MDEKKLENLIIKIKETNILYKKYFSIFDSNLKYNLRTNINNIDSFLEDLLTIYMNNYSNKIPKINNKISLEINEKLEDFINLQKNLVHEILIAFSNTSELYIQKNIYDNYLVQVKFLEKIYQKNNQDSFNPFPGLNLN